MTGKPRANGPHGQLQRDRGTPAGKWDRNATRHSKQREQCAVPAGAADEAASADIPGTTRRTTHHTPHAEFKARKAGHGDNQDATPQHSGKEKGEYSKETPSKETRKGRGAQT